MSAVLLPGGADRQVWGGTGNLRPPFRQEKES